jgi:hypothetical protein
MNDPKVQQRVRRELAELAEMTTDQLRQMYGQVFGEPARSRSKPHLYRKLAWRIQANAFGGLSQRALARAAELANEADVRVTPPPEASGADTANVARNGRRPDGLRPGTVITREYKGNTIEVRVLDRGFEYRGSEYRSLSAVAKAVTGAHWNGRLFFGMKGDNR